MTMFSFLVALALYMSFSPSHPEATIERFLPQTRAFLPIAHAADEDSKLMAPVKKDSLRIGVETSARAALVVDWRTGVPLFEKDADTAYPIASITKLMTALVVLDHGTDMDAMIEIVGNDMRSGSVPYVIPGDRVSVRDLMHVSLISSGNGATIAFARSTGMSLEDFAARMNSLAVELGMQNAHFVEPTGLDPENRASARDVAALIKAALENDLIRETVLRQEYSFTTEAGASRSIRTTDTLLSSGLALPPYGLLGGKTGFLPEAGYCFAAAARNGNGDRVIAVALGAPTIEARFREVKNMIYWAFDAYEWPYAPLE
jgi:D-alanyl-D-alanine endopeptidase (penicillin-binding protein 7)